MTNKTNFSDVQDFHQKFGVPLLTKPGFLSAIAPDAQGFREKFMQEELDEFKESCAAGNLEKSFDALLDLVYVALGTAEMMGCSNEMWQELWNEVQKANMTKVRASSTGESKRGSTLDVIKPAGWTPPDVAHKEILAKYSK